MFLQVVDYAPGDLCFIRKLIRKKIKQLVKNRNLKIKSNIFYKKNTSNLMCKKILQIIKRKEIKYKYFIDA